MASFRRAAMIMSARYLGTEQQAQDGHGIMH